MAKEKKVIKVEFDKQVVVDLLLKEIPNLFDTFPGDSLNRGAVERFVNKITEIYGKL